MRYVPASEAQRLLRRIEPHSTPKHASWPNMAESEAGVPRGQCLDRRIGQRERLASDIKAWQNQRYAARARIDWKLATEQARDGLAYPEQRQMAPALRAFINQVRGLGAADVKEVGRSGSEHAS